MGILKLGVDIFNYFCLIPVGPGMNLLKRKLGASY